MPPSLGKDCPMLGLSTVAGVLHPHSFSGGWASFDCSSYHYSHEYVFFFQQSVHPGLLWATPEAEPLYFDLLALASINSATRVGNGVYFFNGTSQAQSLGRPLVGGGKVSMTVQFSSGTTTTVRHALHCLICVFCGRGTWNFFEDRPYRDVMIYERRKWWAMSHLKPSFAS